MDEVAEQIIEALSALDLDWRQSGEGLFSVTLPGTSKLTTECALEIGEYSVAVRAFVARQPDENHQAVYRYLLEHNLKLYGVCFSLDALGDIYLTGKLARSTITAAEIDRVLGVVATTADTSFNPVVELGFATSIRREWAWRLDRGEPTANLAAFGHMRPLDSGLDEPTGGAGQSDTRGP